MKELYEAVLSEAKKAVQQDKSNMRGSVGFFEETHLLIKETIDLHHCVMAQMIPDSRDVQSPMSNERA